MKATLERAPWLYLNLLRIKRRRHWSRHWVVSTESDICIEGFPRSANSFAFHAFAESQKSPKSLHVATHTHSPAQVRYAVQLGIPTMVCVRTPTEAVRGILAFGLQLQAKAGGSVEMPSLHACRRAISRWQWFHSQILPIRNEFYIATFDRIVKSFDVVSKEFIERFDLPYQPYDPETLPPQKLFDASFHVGPDPMRDQIKAEVRELLQDRSLTNSFQKANELYEELVKG